MTEESDYIAQLEAEVTKSKSESTQYQAAMSQSMYQPNQDNNLIQYQLDTAEILSRIEHFLKGDTLKVDNEGNEYYEAPKKIDSKTKKEIPDTTLVLFNEYGINSIMAIIGNYVDKNTILSYCNEERIYEILADLGDNLANFIFCNYERMGMDTEYKKSRYNLIVLNILHIIESSYRRALGGEEGKRINESRIFTQFDHHRPAIPQVQKTKFHMFKPHTW